MNEIIFRFYVWHGKCLFTAQIQCGLHSIKISKKMSNKILFSGEKKNTTSLIEIVMKTFSVSVAVTTTKLKGVKHFGFDYFTH